MSSVVTNTGKGILSGRLVGSTPSQTEPRWMGWGTGAGAGSVSSTDLSSPASEARVAGTGSQFTTAVTNDTHQVVGIITANGSKVITNVGVFDASGSGSPPAGGNLYVIFDGLSQGVNLGDSLQFTARVQFS